MVADAAVDRLLYSLHRAGGTQRYAHLLGSPDEGTSHALRVGKPDTPRMSSRSSRLPNRPRQSYQWIDANSTRLERSQTEPPMRSQRRGECQSSLTRRQPGLQRTSDAFIDHTLPARGRRPVQLGSSTAAIEKGFLGTGLPVEIAWDSAPIRMANCKLHQPLAKIVNIKTPNSSIIHNQFRPRTSLQLTQIVARR